MKEIEYKIAYLDDEPIVVQVGNDNSKYKTYFTFEDFVEIMSQDKNEFSEFRKESWDRIRELNEEIETLKNNCGDKRLKEISKFINDKLIVLDGEPIAQHEFNVYNDIKSFLVANKLWRE